MDHFVRLPAVGELANEKSAFTIWGIDAATPFEKSNRVEHLLSHTRAVQQFLP